MSAAGAAATAESTPVDEAAAKQRLLVSVVITTYTTARIDDVCELLESLKRQSYPRIEVVFVAEGPAEIRERVQACGAGLGLESLTIAVNTGTPGLSPARNVGIEHSSGEIIAFIDDDAVAPPRWVESIVRAFADHPEAIALTGPAYPLWRGAEARWFPVEFYWIISCPTPGWLGFGGTCRVRNAWGMNMAYRREAFASERFSEQYVGGNGPGAEGIKTGLIGDDTEFCLRLSIATHRPILYDPDVCVQHKVYAYRLTSRFITRRAFWEGYTKATLRRRKANDGIELGLEAALLGRIATRFVPRVLLDLVRRPREASLQAKVATLALGCVALGYLAALCGRPLAGVTRWFSA